MNKIESLNDLIAERKKLKQKVTKIEDSISSMSLFNVLQKIVLVTTKSSFTKILVAVVTKILLAKLNFKKLFSKNKTKL